MKFAWQSIKTIESVLDLAIWLEKQGQQFYEQVRESVDDPELEALCSHLATEEMEHGRIYRQLAEKMTGTPVVQEELFGEYGKFIELLISEMTVNLEIDRKISRQAILEKALLFEKDTLLYFNELKGLFAGEDLQAIQAICDEEKRHITRLLNYRRSLAPAT